MKTMGMEHCLAPKGSHHSQQRGLSQGSIAADVAAEAGRLRRTEVAAVMELAVTAATNGAADTIATFVAAT
jgi:hypothetical protein